ncbi:MAG: hypothetical protein AB7J28_12290 [Hyphomonadaceae bacterium]
MTKVLTGAALAALALVSACSHGHHSTFVSRQTAPNPPSPPPPPPAPPPGPPGPEPHGHPHILGEVTDDLSDRAGGVLHVAGNVMFAISSSTDHGPLGLVSQTTEQLGQTLHGAGNTAQQGGVTHVNVGGIAAGGQGEPLVAANLLAPDPQTGQLLDVTVASPEAPLEVNVAGQNVVGGEGGLGGVTEAVTNTPVVGGVVGGLVGALGPH